MAGSRPPALQRCVGDTARFADEVWAKRAFAHAHPDEGAFTDLLTLEDVDHMLSSMSLRLPAFRLVKEGTTLPTSGYTKSGRTGSAQVSGIADPARILGLFHEGATIVLQGMHRFWPPLARFCRDLELTLGHPTQVNGYITPPGAQGLAVHADSHDVFVLQAFGRKHWEVGPAPAEADAGDRTAPMRVELRPGDCLYMPKGTPHAASTQETISGHLTVGILSTTWRAVLETVLEDQPQLDEPLPAGFHVDPSGFAAQVEAKLADLGRWLDKADARDVADAVTRRFLTTRPSLLAGGLVDAVRLPTIDDETRVRRREGSVCELRTEDGRLVALLGDRELRMPVRLEPSMRDIVASGELSVHDLAGRLDPQSRLVLVRRLVREGMLEVLE